MINNRIYQGFTLLEVMLVVVLLAMVATLVINTLPDTINVPQEEERLTNSLRWAAEQAILEGAIYGVKLDRQGWLIVKLSHNPGGAGESLSWPGYYWRPAGFGHHLLPEGITLELAVENQPRLFPAGKEKSAGSEPQILLLPGGEVTRFSLRLRAHGQTHRQITWHEHQIMLMEAQ